MTGVVADPSHVMKVTHNDIIINPNLEEDLVDVNSVNNKRSAEVVDLDHVEILPGSYNSFPTAVYIWKRPYCTPNSTVILNPTATIWRTNRVFEDGEPPPTRIRPPRYFASSRQLGNLSPHGRLLAVLFTGIHVLTPGNLLTVALALSYIILERCTYELVAGQLLIRNMSSNQQHGCVGACKGTHRYYHRCYYIPFTPSPFR